MSDARTLTAYENHAQELMRDASVPGPLARYFDVAFPRRANRPSRILDVGAGWGRDVVELLARGYDAHGIEPSRALRQIAGEQHPELVSRVQAGSLPGLTALAHGQYDGIVCSAVLQHVPRSRLFESALDLRAMLAPGGRMLISVPGDGHALYDDRRDDRGRLYTGVTPSELELIFERVGCVCLARWTDSDTLERPDLRWTTLLLEARDAAGGRPIDQIATVIGTRERKVATYKLALLRALTDIAQTQAQAVRWRADDRVAVPIEAIALRWIEYYWPLLDTSSPFLPQQQGNWDTQKHTLGFAEEHLELRQHYPASTGGLSAYVIALHNGLPNPAKALQLKLLAALKHTIKEGPVEHAGASLAGGPLFVYERPHVLVPVGLWRELTLLGHWIADSILLRWADLVERLSGKEVRAATALQFLLVVPDAERDTSAVRQILIDRPKAGRRRLRCVWTDRELTPDRVAIDHVLPWSLWHNNDLWNLLPADAKVNLQKSDQLPARQLVRARKATFLDVWSILYDARPERFRREAEAQLGRELGATPDWFDELFDAMSASIESTRLQRGLPEWWPAGTTDARPPGTSTGPNV